jgi:hypothetical protein
MTRRHSARPGIYGAALDGEVVRVDPVDPCDAALDRLRFSIDIQVDAALQAARRDAKQRRRSFGQFFHHMTKGLFNHG